MANDYKNNTTEELNNYVKYREDDLRKAKAQLLLYGKLLDETNIDTIIAMIECMYNDMCNYTWYRKELDEMYEELERRAQEDAESD